MVPSRRASFARLLDITHSFEKVSHLYGPRPWETVFNAPSKISKRKNKSRPAFQEGKGVQREFPVVQWLRLHAPTAAQDRERSNQKKKKKKQGWGRVAQSNPRGFGMLVKSNLGRVGVGGEYSINEQTCECWTLHEV